MALTLSISYCVTNRSSPVCFGASGLPLMHTSIFAGLRCNFQSLVAMILAYVQLDLFQSPKVQDICTWAKCGRSQAFHFLRSLQHCEATAYLKLRPKLKFTGNIEVDASFVTRFWVKADCPAFSTEIHLF